MIARPRAIIGHAVCRSNRSSASRDPGHPRPSCMPSRYLRKRPPRISSLRDNGLDGRRPQLGHADGADHRLDVDRQQLAGSA